MRIMPTRQPERLFCVDIETIPDRTRLPAEWGSKFPKTIHHQVVAISLVEAEIECDGNGRERYAVTSCRSGGEVGWTEPQLLHWFWDYFSRRPTRVVTWNGRCFDIPVLLQRTMVHGQTALGWFTSGSRYDSYGHRYAAEWHCDLMDVLADYGAVKKLSLDEAAAAVGLPGKIGGHGSEVEPMIQAGEAEQVRSYCEVDTLNLFGLYLRQRRLTGRIATDGYDGAVESLLAYLDRERRIRPHFGQFVERWHAGELLGRMAQQEPAGPCPGLWRAG